MRFCSSVLRMLGPNRGGSRQRAPTESYWLTGTPAQASCSPGHALLTALLTLPGPTVLPSWLQCVTVWVRVRPAIGVGIDALRLPPCVVRSCGGALHVFEPNQWGSS